MVNMVRWIFVAVFVIVMPRATPETESTTPTAITPFPSSSASPLRTFDGDLNAIMGPIMKHFLPVFTPLFSDENISPQCGQELLTFLSALRRKEPWAVRVALSTGLIPNNLLEGTLANLGSYEQCLKSIKPSGDISGQYCTMWVWPPEQGLQELHDAFNKEGMLLGRRSMNLLERNIEGHHFGMRFGLCMVSGCSEKDLNYMTNYVAIQYAANISVENCRTEQTEYRPISVLQICILIFVATSLIVVGISTFADLKYTSETLRSSKQPINVRRDLIKAFSLIENVSAVLSTKTADKDLKFLHGLRTMLALWIVYAHGYILLQFETFYPTFTLFDLHTTLHFHFGQGTAFLSVSSFFFLSGFMISYMLSKRPPVTQSIKSFYIESLVRRYVRLTWIVMVVIGYYLLCPLFVAGPLDGDYFHRELNGCYNHWWAVLLHVNNFLPLPQQCYGETWYVSAEMQLFIIALALGLLLMRKPQIAVFIMILLSVTTSAAAFVVTYHYDLLPAVTYGFNTINKLLLTIRYVFDPPYAHVSTYLLGLLCGYSVIKYRDTKIPPKTQLLLWLFSGSLSFFVIAINLVWNSRDEPLPNARLIHAIYAGLHRPLWGIAMFWIVFACATGRGGALNRFWSWNFFVPLGKLSYCIFLTHYMIYLIRLGTQTTVFQLTRFIMIKDGLGIWVLAIIFAFYVYVVHEAPIQRIERIILARIHAKSNRSGKSYHTEPSVKVMNGNSDTINDTKPKHFQDSVIVKHIAKLENESS